MGQHSLQRDSQFLSLSKKPVNLLPYNTLCMTLEL